LRNYLKRENGKIKEDGTEIDGTEIKEDV